MRASKDKKKKDAEAATAELIGNLERRYLGHVKILALLTNVNFTGVLAAELHPVCTLSRHSVHDLHHYRWNANCLYDQVQRPRRQQRQ